MNNYYITYNNTKGTTVSGNSKFQAEEFLKRSNPEVKVINETIKISVDKPKTIKK